MSTLNKVMLIGHLGDEVQLHTFEDGGMIGRFSLATNESYTNKTTNEKVTQTDWHNIVTRNKSAELCEKYLSKGDKIYIEGKIKTRKYQGTDGVDKYVTEIIVDSFKFLVTKGKENASRPNSAVDQYEAKAKAKEEEEEEEPDDLPF